MTEDQRVARNPGEPDKHAPGGARRWMDYLDWIRAEIAEAVLALDGEARRRTLVPSGWTPIELLSHVLHMEQRWFVWGFLGERVDEPWGDWTVEEPWTAGPSGDAASDARWQVPDHVTAEELSTRLEAVGARTREVLTRHPLDAVSSPGGRFADDPPSLEWICFHVLTEYARHAGHLDIVVELGA